MSRGKRFESARRLSFFTCKFRKNERHPTRASGALSAHEPIEERGCKLLYVPPYSPDLNPIEEALSKVKGLLPETEVRTHEALVETIGRALSPITAQDTLSYFERCGYHASDRPLFDVLLLRTRRSPPPCHGQPRARTTPV
jgi:hypothetical protein